MLEPRRSSSLQLPLSANVFKVSTRSLASATAINGPSQSTVNLYSSMARYRCCGICRLRMAGLLVGASCVAVCVFVLAWSGYWSSLLNEKQRVMLRMPILLLTIGQLMVSSLFCAAITVEWHMIILPFLLGCLICIMGSLGSGMVLLVSTDRALQRFYPVIATGSAMFVVLFVWFLVVSSMCFVMYRDKRRLRDDLFDFTIDNEHRHMDRVNSSYF